MTLCSLTVHSGEIFICLTDVLTVNEFLINCTYPKFLTMR